jgi:hypothetical protein
MIEFRGFKANTHFVEQLLYLAMFIKSFVVSCIQKANNKTLNYIREIRE